MPKKSIPLSERLFSRIEIDPMSGCWLYTGYLNADGYGMIGSGGRGGPNLLAHRASYGIFFGKIPDGYQVDHTCHTKTCPGNCQHARCVNPKHLEAVTPAINNERRLNGMLKKTCCAQGHPFNKENTYYTQTRRVCKICNARAGAAWYQKKKLERSILKG